MHPAYSVIFFTTSSGAGYGLLIWLGLLGPAGFVPPTRGFGLVGIGGALALITAGLLSSTAHLGRPERAWRALSQWRSSWLSREGLAALATYVPAVVLGMGWVFLGRTDGVFALAGLLAAALAFATVVCTGMIYASLPTIRAWHQPLVTPVYLVLALATGALLLNLVMAAFAIPAAWASWLAAATLLTAWIVKVASWRTADLLTRTHTIAQATGLGHLGRVRSLEPPHSQPNYVMREMGYEIARTHALKLRRMAMLTAFALPTVLSALAFAAGPALAFLLVLLATVSAGVGVLVERWLFFAEAEHVAMLYYGRQAA